MKLVSLAIVSSIVVVISASSQKVTLPPAAIRTALPTPSPSAQLCYWDANQLASADVVPCFENSDAKVVSPCCLKGSNCLENNACWDGSTGITYQYGCTDPTYKDPHCPEKCGLDRTASHWTGLVYCNGTANTPNMTWICHHPDTCGQKCSKRVPWDPLLERGLPKVSCEDLDMEKVAIYADSPLDTILHIPWEEDALASYISAHPMPTNGSVNSDSSSMTPWAAYSAPSGILTSIPPAVTTSTPGKVSSVGLGVSLGIGLPCGVALMGFVTYFWLRRRHQKASVAIDHHGQEKYHHEESPDSGGGGGAESRFTTKAELSAAPMDPAELESVASPTIQSPIQSHPGSVRTSMISPTTSEFNDLGGGPGPVERWEVAGNEIRPVYELEG